jgi:hypothetical protein
MLALTDQFRDELHCCVDGGRHNLMMIVGVMIGSGKRTS